MHMCIYVLDYTCEKLFKMHVNTIFEDYRMKFDENEIAILTVSILTMQ